MAESVWTDARIEVNSVVLSDRSNECTISNAMEMKDKSTFGGSARLNKAGLKTHEITIKFLEDFATSEVNQTLWPLYNAGTEFTLDVRMTSSAASAANPGYAGTFVISSYPQGGSHGELLEATVVFALADDDFAKYTS